MVRQTGAKADFSLIGKHRSVFDTDLMSVGRRQIIINPDGSESETLPDEPIYTDLPCHLSYISQDNPNPDTVDTKPVIVSIRITCDVATDLQNNDYITALKRNVAGEVLGEYKGNIGTPSVFESRKEAVMGIREDV